MKIKQTFKSLVLFVAMTAGLAIVAGPSTVAALGNNGCETNTSIIKCTDVSNSGKVENTGVWSLLKLTINIMTAGIGVLAVAGVVYGSILYASAGGSAEQTKKAMGIITNVVVGILAYALMYAVLNFLIPGGLFG